MLAAVVVAEAALFAATHAERWRKSLRPLDRPGVRAGEGLVVRCDGLGYYAWLRSLLVDGDWSFDNEFDSHNPLNDFVPPPTPRTETGRRPNLWSVGPACVWAVLLVPVHAAVSALQAWGLPWPADGYSLPYQLAVGLTTVAASWLSLVCTYAACRRFAPAPRAAFATAVMLLGTPAVYYAAVEGSMAHGVGTAAVALLVWYWLWTYGSESPARWLLLGSLVGLVALVRWQLATLVVLPVGEWCLGLRQAAGRAAARQAPRPSIFWWHALSDAQGVVRIMPSPLRSGRATRPCGVTPSAARQAPRPPGLEQHVSFPFGQARLTIRHLSLAMLAALGAVAAFLPQMLAWRCVFGHWLVRPFPTAHNWLTPALWQVLASTDRGFLYWTPAALLACGGYFAALPRLGERLGFLFAAFLLQVYVVASLWGEQAYLGASFGFRQLTETAPVLAPGLALLLARASAGRFRVLAVLGIALVAWNMTLIAQYRLGWIPADGGAGPGTLLANGVHLLRRKPTLTAIQILPAPVLLALGLWLAAGPPRVRANFPQGKPLRPAVRIINRSRTDPCGR